MIYKQTDGGSVASGLDEQNDCVVRALAIAGQISFKQAYDIAAATGRKPNGGASFQNCVTRAHMAGYFKYELLERNWPSKTLSQFVQANPQGRFVVRVKSSTRGWFHVITIINGVLYDSPKNGVRKGNTRVLSSWSIEL